MGSHRGGSSTVAAGTLDAGGMEDEEEEITADTLRCRHRPLPLSALSAFSYIPPRRLDPKEHSYYYRQGKVRRRGLHCGAPRVGVREGSREGGSGRRGTAGGGLGEELLVWGRRGPQSLQLPRQPE